MRSITDLPNTCEVEGCQNKASTLAYDRDIKKMFATCEDCADEVADKLAPEYIEKCPNCGCVFGVK